MGIGKTVKLKMVPLIKNLFLAKIKTGFFLF